MPLKLLYITNRPDVARAAENAGVDCIFVDFEYIGKDKRQFGLNTVKNHHSPEDVKAIRNVITKSELLVRVNPIHERSPLYSSSEEEINDAIENGADIIMLPYFRTVEEVKKCIDYIGGRAKFYPLLETPEAVEHIDEIMELEGIDAIHIGINDLSIGYNNSFMFELLVDGTVDRLCEKFKRKGLPFGFGGIASIGNGLVPAEYIISRHYWLGSTMTILSRSFCNIQEINDTEQIRTIFNRGIKEIREYESQCQKHLEEKDYDFFERQLVSLKRSVNNVVSMRRTQV